MEETPDKIMYLEEIKKAKGYSPFAFKNDV